MVGLRLRVLGRMDNIAGDRLRQAALSAVVALCPLGDGVVVEDHLIRMVYLTIVTTVAREIGIEKGGIAGNEIVGIPLRGRDDGGVGSMMMMVEEIRSWSACYEVARGHTWPLRENKHRAVEESRLRLNMNMIPCTDRGRNDATFI